MNREWAKVITKGDLPSPRSFHSLMCSDDFMLIFGGLDGQRKNDLFVLNIFSDKGLSTETNNFSRSHTGNSNKFDQGFPSMLNRFDGGSPTERSNLNSARQSRLGYEELLNKYKGPRSGSEEEEGLNPSIDNSKD